MYKRQPSSKLEKIKKIPARRTGTRVRFWPDTDIFDPDARIDHERVRDHVAEVCFLVPTLKAVSYTHLDVYKRQVQVRSCQERW